MQKQLFCSKNIKFRLYTRSLVDHINRCKDYISSVHRESDGGTSLSRTSVSFLDDSVFASHKIVTDQIREQ